MARTNWQRFFDSHAPHYDENGFTRHTSSEIDFLLALFPLVPPARILDVGCGTGRHCIELAARGFSVTGVDFSEGMLAVARAKAEAAGASVSFVLANATAYVADIAQDAAICLCEGAVGIVERAEDAESHDTAILNNISASLKRGAPFLLTALNGYATIRQMSDALTAEGRFDPASMRSNYEDVWQLPEGEAAVRVQERLFIPPEMVRMLEEVGFEVLHVFGGTAGQWMQRPVSLDEVEAMYVCVKRD